MGVSEQTKRWIQAAKILAEDPETEVACPNCGGKIETRDVPWSGDPSQFERYLVCPYCGTVEVIRMRGHC